MTRQEIEPPSCWIKGDMEPSDLVGDEVRQVTQSCQYRKSRPSRSIFGGNEHICTHPAAISEHEEIQNLPDEVMACGVDGYATYCEPVDIHLTSLGEKSRFIIEGKFRVISDETKKLCLPEPSNGNK